MSAKTKIADVVFCEGAGKNRGRCPFYLSPDEKRTEPTCKRRDCDNLTGMPVMESAGIQEQFVYPDDPPSPENPLPPE